MICNPDSFLKYRADKFQKGREVLYNENADSWCVALLRQLCCQAGCCFVGFMVCFQRVPKIKTVRWMTQNMAMAPMA